MPLGDIIGLSLRYGPFFALSFFGALVFLCLVRLLGNGAGSHRIADVETIFSEATRSGRRSALNWKTGQLIRFQFIRLEVESKRNSAVAGVSSQTKDD
jgi:hypothetical protein